MGGEDEETVSVCRREARVQRWLAEEEGLGRYVRLVFPSIVDPRCVKTFMSWDSSKPFSKYRCCPQVNAFRLANPEMSRIRTACIIDGIPCTLGHQFEALKVDAVSVGKGFVTADFVADCQRRGIQLWVWTVNNVHYMERLLVRRVLAP